MGFWMTRVRRPNGEFSAHFPARGKAENSSSLPLTASVFGAGVAGRFERGSGAGLNGNTVGDAPITPSRCLVRIGQ
jgi:hypothetical protein